MLQRILFCVVLVAAVVAPGGASPAGAQAPGGPAESHSEATLLAHAPSVDVVLAARYLLAEATKADALEKVYRLRGHRRRTLARIAAADGPAELAAESSRIKRLDAKLVAEWSRWRRSNRRSHQARQAAAALNPATKSEGPMNVEAGSPTSAQWEALRQCEAGGNYEIVSANGLYHGAYQFSRATWESVGGAGSPAQATPEEQDKRASLLFARRGAGPWPHCGRYLET